MKAGGMKLMQMQWDFPDKIRINNLNIPIINILVLLYFKIILERMKVDICPWDIFD
jgi:protein-tyrosine phosphatase